MIVVISLRDKYHEGRPYPFPPYPAILQLHLHYLHANSEL
jgi:hypothetical protein